MNEYTNSTSADAERSRSGLVNALLGAVVMTVFSWIPFAPVVGGALSGYLEAGEHRDDRLRSRRGIRIGALAGALAAIPALLVIAFVGSIFTVGWLGTSVGGGMNPGLSLGFSVLAWVVVALVVVVGVVYHVGLSALGGWLGAELATREDRRPEAPHVQDGTPGRDSRNDDRDGTDLDDGNAFDELAAGDDGRDRREN
jgi:hypothetical protein